MDIEPEEIGRNSIVHLPVVSDIREFLGECNRLLEEQKAGPALTAQFSPWIAELREKETAGINLGRLASESGKVPIHPARLAREIDLFMDREEDIVVGDGGDTQVWMGMFRTVRKEGHYLESGLYGCLGVGIPYAIAAKLLYPQKRVLNVIGDGSVGFNFMEFETAIRKKIPIVVVISNDLGWGMIRHSSKLKLGRTIEEASEIGQIHYEKFVESMGGFGNLRGETRRDPAGPGEGLRLGETGLHQRADRPDRRRPGRARAGDGERVQNRGVEDMTWRARVRRSRNGWTGLQIANIKLQICRMDDRSSE